MMFARVSFVALLLAVVQSVLASQTAPAVSPQVFVGTWVGTQRWNVGTPPPGASGDQPVSLTIEIINGKLHGTLTPFMGGDDGAVFTDANIIADELHAFAEFGKPPAPSAGAAAKATPVDEEEGPFRIVPNRVRRPGWKDTVRIQMTFKADRLDLKGTADVMMNEVKWLRFEYDLSKKRSRY